MGNTKEPQLTILIPALNEEKRIGKTLNSLADYLKEHHYNALVMVVDANSTDKTKSVADAAGRRFSHYQFLQTGPKVGKGKQVRDGMLAATTDYVMFMDADLATPLKYLDEVFSLIENKGRVAICVRNLGESHRGIRKFISTFGNWLTQTLIVPGIKDTQCGFKAFERNAAREIFGRQRIVGWGFDMEVLAIARKLGYPIELIDVPDWRDVVEGSKISGNGALKVAIQTFGDLLKIKWGLLIGKYNKVSFRYAAYKE